MNQSIRTDKLKESLVLPFFSFDVYETLKKARRLFPELDSTLIRVWIQPQETLAFIRSIDTQHTIYLHEILNHPDTPEEVIEFIFIHELIHTRIPGRKIKGVMKMHPPEFIEEEKRLAPDSSNCMGWIYINLGAHIYVNKKREKIVVKKEWEKSKKGGRYLSYQEYMEKFGIKNTAPPNDMLL